MVHIFGAGRDQSRVQQVAWQQYLIWSGVTKRGAVLLMPLYREIARASVSADDQGDVDRHTKGFVQHLLALYIGGDIELLDLTSPLRLLFDHGPAAVRAFAVGHAGFLLYAHHVRLTRSQRHRLLLLWEARLTAARTDPPTGKPEVAAFARWFGSKALDEGWRCRQLETVLTEFRTMRDPWMVLTELHAISSTDPEVAVRLLSLLFAAVSDGWMFSDVRGEESEIIAAALTSENVNAQASAQELIGRLLASGRSQYSQLLENAR